MAAYGVEGQVLSVGGGVATVDQLHYYSNHHGILIQLYKPA